MGTQPRTQKHYRTLIGIGVVVFVLIWIAFSSGSESDNSRTTYVPSTGGGGISQSQLQDESRRLENEMRINRGMNEMYNSMPYQYRAP